MHVEEYENSMSVIFVRPTVLMKSMFLLLNFNLSRVPCTLTFDARFVLHMKGNTHIFVYTMKYYI